MSIKLAPLLIALAVGIGAIVGVIALIVAAFRRSSSNGFGVLATMVVGLVIIFAGFAGLVLPITRLTGQERGAVSIGPPQPVAVATISQSESTTTSAPVAGATKVVVHSHARRGSSGSPVHKSIMAAISLAALLVLARVAADGRKRGGYGAAARIVAALAFAGVCALLYSLRPLL